MTCPVCSTLVVDELAELDALMSTPAAWPSTVWTLFRPPPGMLPASYRRFGAIAMARLWLDDHDHREITTTQIRRHYRFDVPKLEVDVAELVETGLIERGRLGGPAPPLPLVFDPGAYLGFYSRGLALGNKALEHLEKRIQKLIDEDKEVPWLWIKAAMDLGSKLASSQAAIKAAGKVMGNEDDDSDAFRAGAAGGQDNLPSPRFGHSRIRRVEGEARPVHDEGPADRATYAERAREEGGRGL